MSGAQTPALFFGMPRLGQRGPLESGQVDLMRVAMLPSPNYRAHSVQLNRIAWRMARALDLVHDGQGCAYADLDVLADRFFAMVEREVPQLDPSQRRSTGASTAELVQQIHDALPADASAAHAAVDHLATRVHS